MGQKDLPLGPGSKHVKAFERLGWLVARDGKGHTILEKPGHEAHLSVPNHKE